MSNEVAVRVRGGSEIAPLYDRSTFNVDAGDIALPKVYICQALTKAVQDELAKAGDVIVAAGAEDPDAEVVYSAKEGGVGVLFHVLRVDKGKSFSENNGPLQSWAFNDPAAHPDAWTTYTYTVALPDIDPDMPHKLLLTRSNQGTARRINLLLAKSVQRGGHLYDLAFRLTTEPKQNDKGKWYIAVVKAVEPDSEGITVSESLSDMVNSTPAAAPTTAAEDAPAI